MFKCYFVAFSILLILFLRGEALSGQSARADSLVRELENAESDTHKIRILGDLSVALKYTAPEKALQYASQQLVLSRRAQWKKGIVSSYDNIGSVLIIQEDFSRALDSLFKGLKIARELKDQKQIANFYLRIGVINNSIRNYKKSLDYSLLGMNILEKLGDEQQIGRACLNVGYAYAMLKEYEPALKWYQRGAGIAEKRNDKARLCNFYVNIGDIHAALENYPEALAYEQKALAISKETGAKRITAYCEGTIGEIYDKMGMFGKAIKHLKVSLRMAQEIDSKDLIKNLYMILSRVYTKLGRYKEANEHLLLHLAARDSIDIGDLSIRMAELENREKNEIVHQRLKLLSKENEIQYLKIRKNQYFIGGLISIVFLTVFIGVLFIRQIRLKESHKVLQLEQKALRAQINPHFLFNALNSIQKFIMKGDKTNARNYIGKFSTLMRSILDNSDSTFVPIEEELAAVKLYLEIEQLRVNHHFDFEIMVQEDIDVYNINMPSMLIQPYVENAIWHGLINKEADGKVIVDVRKANGNIFFTILDNGVGRQNTIDPLRKDSSHHKPSGMKLVKDRVNVINKISRTNIRVVVTDLFRQNVSCGTKVEIIMPVKT